MNTTPMNWILISGGLVILLAAIVALFVSFRQRKSQRLQRRFGPEYGRAVDDMGNRTKAESELEAREKRVGQLTITPLSANDAARFTQAWNAMQGRFVDNPKGVVIDADRLVRELMMKRGYPMGDFEHRAADISVDHPAVVENYRAAQAIAVRDERGEADTEELRKAVVHYRTLFDELLQIEAGPEETLAAPHIPAHS
jgi:hypothetical protein